MSSMSEIDIMAHEIAEEGTPAFDIAVEAIFGMIEQGHDVSAIIPVGTGAVLTCFDCGATAVVNPDDDEPRRRASGKALMFDCESIADGDVPPLRKARVMGDIDRKRVDAYLPSHYDTYRVGDEIIIAGYDWMGWTLDGYVIPRLASGNIFVEKITE